MVTTTCERATFMYTPTMALAFLLGPAHFKKSANWSCIPPFATLVPTASHALKEAKTVNAHKIVRKLGGDEAVKEFPVFLKCFIEAHNHESFKLFHGLVTNELADIFFGITHSCMFF